MITHYSARPAAVPLQGSVGMTGSTLSLIVIPIVAVICLAVMQTMPGFESESRFLRDFPFQNYISLLVRVQDRACYPDRGTIRAAGW